MYDHSKFIANIQITTLSELFVNQCDLQIHRLNYKERTGHKFMSLRSDDCMLATIGFETTIVQSSILDNFMTLIDSTNPNCMSCIPRSLFTITSYL